MNVLTTEKRVQVVAALVEGTSINATCRMTDAAKHTVLNDHVWTLEELVSVLSK